MCAICGNTGIRRTLHGQTFCECEYGLDARKAAEKRDRREAEALAQGETVARPHAVVGTRVRK